MHPTTRSHRLAVLVALTFALGALAGCISGDAREAPGIKPTQGLLGEPEPSDDGAGGDNGNGNGDIAQPGEDPEEPGQDPQPDPEPEPRPLPTSWTVTARDGRSGAWEAPRVEAHVEWTGVLQPGSTLRVEWVAPDGTAVNEEADPDSANGTIVLLRDFAGGIGTHDVRVTVNWTAADGQTDERSAAITLEVFESLRIIVDASKAYTSDQNVFSEDRLVAFAPWDEDSAHDLLHRMGETYGFAVESYYREDLDSWFVDSINGTSFQWGEPEALGISYNWMLLVNGEKTQTAADDTFPALDDVVEFRYVKCYSTGQCDRA